MEEMAADPSPPNSELVSATNIYVKQDPENIKLGKIESKQSVTKGKLQSTLPDHLRLEINPKAKME